MIKTTTSHLAESIGVGLNEPFSFIYENQICKGLISHSGFHMRGPGNGAWITNQRVLSRLVEGTITVMKEA